MTSGISGVTLNLLGLYTPAVILLFIALIYVMTCILHPRTKSKIFWTAVALAFVIGAAGAGYELLRTGTLTAPASLD